MPQHTEHVSQDRDPAGHERWFARIMPRAIEHEVSQRHDGPEDQKLCCIDHGDILNLDAPDTRQATEKGMVNL